MVVLQGGEEDESVLGVSGRVENGELRMENGEWRVESGEWRVENSGGCVVNINCI